MSKGTEADDFLQSMKLHEPEPVHAHIDRVPAAKPLRESPPFTALLRHIQNCVQDLQVAQTHVAALHRQTVLMRAYCSCVISILQTFYS